MYATITAILILAGILLLIFAGKITRTNKLLKICLRVTGLLFIVIGFLLLYFVVYGTMLLPLD